MVEELLKQIPADRCWEITSKTLSALFVLRGEKIIAPLLGKGEGIISPIWGAEKWIEINIKIFGDAGKLLCPMFKDMFNVSVKDAIEAHKLETVAYTLSMGPEFEGEYVEKTPERVVNRCPKCPWWERYKEFEADLAFTACDKGAHQAWGEEGHKSINPKITYKLTKAMPRGDPYCEIIVEFKDE